MRTSCSTRCSLIPLALIWRRLSCAAWQCGSRTRTNLFDSNYFASGDLGGSIDSREAAGANLLVYLIPLQTHPTINTRKHTLSRIDIYVDCSLPFYSRFRTVLILSEHFCIFKSDAVLPDSQGTIFWLLLRVVRQPALHRLEKSGWICYRRLL
jgi:hypothetical protein